MTPSASHGGVAGKRPISVTLVGWLFAAAGVVGVAYHGSELSLRAPFSSDLILALCVRLLAIAGGVFVLRGADWARWLVLLWMAYHVVLSAFHPLPELIVHGVILTAVACVLLRRRASAYFRRSGATWPPD